MTKFRDSASGLHDAALSGRQRSTGMAELPEVQRAIKAALNEDIGPGDITTLALVPPNVHAKAAIISRERCVVAGLHVAAAVFRTVDPEIEIRLLVSDGDVTPCGVSVMKISGRARALLAAERTALNFLQRMSGIATRTRMFVEAVRGTDAVILDTRKTTPCLRALEKYAVLCGGGRNHRMGLFDRVLIKDNHRRLWRSRSRRLADAVKVARKRFPNALVEIEVDNENELRDALRGSPDWVLLDNMDVQAVRRCVQIVRGRCKIEVSGGVNLKTARCIARTGVDAISVGAITHSSPAADFSMEFE